MEIRIAVEQDITVLTKYDHHISKDELLNSIRLNRVYIGEMDGKFIGWLRFNLFWDNTPFMNMLFLLDDYRGSGFGKELVNYWEEKMKKLNHEVVMTSTASDEYAQHFYVKKGYQTVGGFNFLEDPYEIIMMKKL